MDKRISFNNLKRNFNKSYIFSNQVKCLTSNMDNIYTKVPRIRLLRKKQQI